MERGSEVHAVADAPSQRLDYLGANLLSSTVLGSRNRYLSNGPSPANSLRMDLGMGGKEYSTGRPRLRFFCSRIAFGFGGYCFS